MPLLYTTHLQAGSQPKTRHGFPSVYAPPKTTFIARTSSTRVSRSRSQLRSPTPPVSRTGPSEEPPPQEEDDNQPQHPERRVLLHQQLPVDPHRRPLVLLAVVPQPARELAHPLEAVPAVQQVLDVLGHDLRHVAQLVVEAVKVLRGARVRVGGLCAGDEGVEVHEGVGAEGRGVERRGGVGGCELAGEVG